MTAPKYKYRQARPWREFVEEGREVAGIHKVKVIGGPFAVTRLY
jgi:hypothetical protein